MWKVILVIAICLILFLYLLRKPKENKQEQPHTKPQEQPKAHPQAQPQTQSQEPQPDQQSVYWATTKGIGVIDQEAHITLDVEQIMLTPKGDMALVFDDGSWTTVDTVDGQVRSTPFKSGPLTMNSNGDVIQEDRVYNYEPGRMHYLLVDSDV